MEFLSTYLNAVELLGEHQHAGKELKPQTQPRLQKSHEHKRKFHQASKGLHLCSPAMNINLASVCGAQGDRVYLGLGEGVGPDAAPSGKRAAALINLSKSRHTGSHGEKQRHPSRAADKL